MGKPFLLAENFYSLTQFPTAILSFTEESSGREGFRIADGRRSIYDHWVGVTANLQQVLKVQLASARTANMVVLDRGHNLAGKSVLVDHSDNGSSWTNDVTATIPTSSTADSNPDGANGAVTEEGAWIKRFTGSSHAYWRFLVPAVASFAPSIVGLWIGADYEPGFFFMPWDEDQNNLMGEELVSEWGWHGRGPQATIREGEFAIKLSALSDYATARYVLHNLYGGFRPGGNRPQPMWICFDDANVERAFLALRPMGGRLSVGYETGWFPRQARIAYAEHEPLRT